MANQDQKIVNVNIDAAKKKVKDASDKMVTTTQEKLKDAKKSVQETVEARKNSALSRLVDKGLELSKKQLAYFERLKTKTK